MKMIDLKLQQQVDSISLDAALSDQSIAFRMKLKLILPNLVTHFVGKNLYLPKRRVAYVNIESNPNVYNRG